MTKNRKAKFDFEHWVRLAQEDPEQFEQMREQRIREMIETVPDELRQRIEGLQWRIDQLRQTAKSPLASCIRISSMMWDSVLGDEGLVQTLENLGKEPRSGSRKADTGAQIIEFSRSRDPEQDDLKAPEN